MAFLEGIMDIHPADIDYVWNLCLETLEMVGLGKKKEALEESFGKKFQLSMPSLPYGQIGTEIECILVNATEDIINAAYPHLTTASFACGSASFISIEHSDFFKLLYMSGIEPEIIRNVIRSNICQHFQTPEDMLAFCHMDWRDIFALVTANEDVYAFQSVDELGMFSMEYLAMPQMDPHKAGLEMLHAYQTGDIEAMCVSLPSGICLYAGLSANALLMQQAEQIGPRTYQIRLDSPDDTNAICRESDCCTCWHVDKCVADNGKYPQVLEFILPDNWTSDIQVHDDFQFVVPDDLLPDV